MGPSDERGRPMNDHRRQQRIRRAIQGWLSMVLLALICATAVLPASAEPSGQGDPRRPARPARPGWARGRGWHREHIKRGPVDVLRRPAKSPRRPSISVRGQPVDKALVGTHAVDPIDLKALIITADGSESSLPAIKAFLDQIGMPYNVYQVINPATGAKTPLTASRLWDGALHGYYQSIFLATDSLVYF